MSLPFPQPGADLASPPLDPDEYQQNLYCGVNTAVVGKHAVQVEISAYFGPVSHKNKYVIGCKEGLIALGLDGARLIHFTKSQDLPVMHNETGAAGEIKKTQHHGSVKTPGTPEVGYSEAGEQSKEETKGWTAGFTLTHKSLLAEDDHKKRWVRWTRRFVRTGYHLHPFLQEQLTLSASCVCDSSAAPTARLLYRTRAHRIYDANGEIIPKWKQIALAIVLLRYGKFNKIGQKFEATFGLQGAS